MTVEAIRFLIGTAISEKSGFELIKLEEASLLGGSSSELSLCEVLRND